MKKYFCRTVILLLCLMMLLSACGKTAKGNYRILKEMKIADSGVVAENQDYQLVFDGNRQCVMLRHKESDAVWSSSPYEHYLSDETSMSLDSPIVIKYYDTSNGGIDTLRAYESADEGGVSSVIKNSAVYVTYHFDSVKIAVTLCYELSNDSLKVTLKNSDVKENAEVKLLSVDILPYMCSVKNTADKNDYLFLPSGSGALMYTDEEAVDSIREFSGAVYGYDRSQTRLDNPAEAEPIRLPVFGAKAGPNAILGIIEKGAESCDIVGMAGNPRNGYSNAYITYNIRGYNNIEWDSATKDTVTDSILLSEERNTEGRVEIGFYPLMGEQASYSGMAERYRRYLEERQLLQKSDINQKKYHITFLGGAQVTAFTLGIPHKSLVLITSFKETQKILGELGQANGDAPSVVLKGYGESGVTVSKLGGGFSFSGALGSKGDRKALYEYCDSKKIPLYVDFDIINFSRSGNGFSTFFDVASTANSLSASYYPTKVNVRTENTELEKIRLVKRSKLEAAAEKVLKATEKNGTGISLSTLSNTVYSDYSDTYYALNGGMEQQVNKIFRSIKKADRNIALSAANAYAAGIADSIYDVPLQNGGYDMLDQTVPFYEMVYHGYIPLYTTAVNLSPDSNKHILKAIEAGVSPSFTLGYNTDRSLIDADGNDFYGINYNSNKQLIKDMVDKTSEFIEKIADSVIISHEILFEGVTETVFSNGVSVIVNHSDREVTVVGERIAAESFLIK